jgi:hypothetical protein
MSRERYLNKTRGLSDETHFQPMNDYLNRGALPPSHHSSMSRVSALTEINEDSPPRIGRFRPIPPQTLEDRALPGLQRWPHPDP